MMRRIRKMIEKSKGVLRSNKGQGLVEYALILVLIAIVVIVAVRGVGCSTNNAFTKINSALQ
ncbi:MAG TPA: Flp family type IVb pilin [Geobacter sp.]|nr:Flp family type IVb pilin [Geobacter sp.]